MQLGELIANVDEIKPNQYSKEIKVAWLNEVEAKIVEQIISRYKEIEFTKYDYDLDVEKELIVPDEFCDVYMNYICSKIAFYNAEYPRYNNFASLYNQSFEDVAKYYRRKHKPLQRHNLKPF